MVKLICTIKSNTERMAFMGKVITIGRQLGSNGKIIGRMLAERLGYKFYDKDIIADMLKKQGFGSAIFEGIDEKPTNSFLYSLVMGVQTGKGLYYQYNDLLNGDNVFKVQADLIRDIAKDGDSVIVGRCADYILRNHEHLTKLFLYADKDYRQKTIMERNGVSEKEALSAISKADKRRANFYNFYTNQAWGQIENYDLAVNTGKCSQDAVVDVIEKYLQVK